MQLQRSRPVYKMIYFKLLLKGNYLEFINWNRTFKSSETELVNRLVKVPKSFYSFKQILRKYVKIIDNFSFDKGATVVANKKDHFIYF